MRVFWESIGILGPIYRMAGQDFSNREMAVRLHVSEHAVESCIVWMLHSLQMKSRAELVAHATSTASVIPRRRIPRRSAA